MQFLVPSSSRGETAGQVEALLSLQAKVLPVGVLEAARPDQSGADSVSMTDEGQAVGGGTVSGAVLGLPPLDFARCVPAGLSLKLERWRVCDHRPRAPVAQLVTASQQPNMEDDTVSGSEDGDSGAGAPDPFAAPSLVGFVHVSRTPAKPPIAPKPLQSLESSGYKSLPATIAPVMSRASALFSSPSVPKPVTVLAAPSASPARPDSSHLTFGVSPSPASPFSNLVGPALSVSALKVAPPRTIGADVPALKPSLHLQTPPRHVYRRFGAPDATAAAAPSTAAVDAASALSFTLSEPKAVVPSPSPFGWGASSANLPSPIAAPPSGAPSQSTSFRMPPNPTRFAGSARFSLKPK